MSDPKVIKRYANRKLYDTQRSRYVTLEQIADMIRDGQDVRIVDNTSKEDLTSITLAQIIFEQEKNKKASIPLGAMRNIIQSGGASISELASQAGARVRQVFARGEGAEATSSVEEEGAGTSESAGNSVLRDLLERSQLSLEDWQKKVDERVHKVVEALAPWTGLEREVTELQARIVDLEKRLAESEQRGGRVA